MHILEINEDVVYRRWEIGRYVRHRILLNAVETTQNQAAIFVLVCQNSWTAPGIIGARLVCVSFGKAPGLL